MLLFGFPGGHLVDPVRNEPESPDKPIRVVCEPLPPEPPKDSSSSQSEEPARKSEFQPRRISEPPPPFQPDGVLVPYRPDPGQLPQPDSTFTGIPDSQDWGGSGPAPKVVWDDRDLEKKPEPVAQVAPSYPFDAKNQHLEGVVVVRFIVTAAGAVESATVGSTTHPVFNEPALAAVRKWRFKAGIKNGANVATRMEIPLAFHLKD